MGPPSYMQSVTDQHVVMRRMTVTWIPQTCSCFHAILKGSHTYTHTHTHKTHWVTLLVFKTGTERIKYDAKALSDLEISQLYLHHLNNESRTQHYSSCPHDTTACSPTAVQVCWAVTGNLQPPINTTGEAIKHTCLSPPPPLLHPACWFNHFFTVPTNVHFIHFKSTKILY
jgi:hypothetical protein